MQLIEGSKSTASGGMSNGVKNRKLHQLNSEGSSLDNTLKMTQDIISQGSDASRSLHGQQEKLEKTKGKLGTMSSQVIT